MKRIIILTGSETRHSFFRKYIALQDEIEVLASYCEGQNNTIHSVVEKRDENDPIEIEHLKRRKIAEDDFFGLFNEFVKDKSNPKYLRRGDVSSQKIYNEIVKLEPDIIIAYGCSLLKGPLLSSYKNKILNVHLGLSPYYRGSGTNFWCLVNNEPEYMGATYMYLDEGVDTGKIIHQIRPEIYLGDSPNQIGNRLIKKMAEVYAKIIQNFESLENRKNLKGNLERHVYRRADYNGAAVKKLYQNFEEGMVDEYLKDLNARNHKVAIIKNTALGDEKQ